MLRRLLTCVLFILIILVPVPASQPSPVRPIIGLHSGVTRPDWITFTAVMCRHYRVRAAFAIGVAFAESSKGRADFRFDRVGRYWLPWGIHDCFARRWPIWDIYVQTEVAVRALARYNRLIPVLGRRAVEVKALRKYNASFNPGYLRRVREGERRFGRLCR